MQVQTNGSYPFSNPYASSSPFSAASDKEAPGSEKVSQIKNDFSMIAQDLSPAERKLYDNLIYTENYDAARGLVAIGFLRAAGLYQDTEGSPLPGVSLPQDIARLSPPSAPRDRNAIAALGDYLAANPSALTPDKEKRGNFIDLKV